MDKLVCNLALLIKSSRIEKSPEKLPSNNWSRLTDKGTSEPSDGEHMLGSSSIFLNLKISLPACYSTLGLLLSIILKKKDIDIRNTTYNLHYILGPESKEKRGENSDFWFLGRTVRADIFGRIYLGSKKFSQMAAFVGKSKNIESSLNLNNYCQISIQLACLT